MNPTFLVTIRAPTPPRTKMQSYVLKNVLPNMGCKCAGMRLGGGEAAGHSIPLRACIAQAPI